MRFRSNAGFSLVELMIVVAILGILLLVVAPDFGRFLADGRVNAAKDKLISSISLARTEAIKRGEQVVICRANAAGTSCAGGGIAATSESWADGWLVFADADEDEALDVGELLRVVTVEDQTTIQFSRDDLLIFGGQGLLVDTSGNFIAVAVGEQAFTIGDRGDATVEAGLSVRSTGRIRSCANWNVSTHTCSDN
ncbi:MAG: GspH/FimT family pseudopilin [Amphritea sp.]|nr:GspH/FimT family pseudopilin [Amphritea sp.]